MERSAKSSIEAIQSPHFGAAWRFKSQSMQVGEGGGDRGGRLHLQLEPPAERPR